MTQKEWILKNLEGKVQKRALRVCRERRTLTCKAAKYCSIDALFVWGETKEGHKYWEAVSLNDPNPDQYLPEGYVDVDHVVEPNEMIKDEFLKWLERKIELTREDNDLQREHWAFCQSYKKYNELKK